MESDVVDEHVVVSCGKALESHKHPKFLRSLESKGLLADLDHEHRWLFRILTRRVAEWACGTVEVAARELVFKADVVGLEFQKRLQTYSLGRPECRAERTEPNRWLCIKHPNGFSDAQYGEFTAHCRIWRSYVEAVLNNWNHLSLTDSDDPPRYEFFEPELSKDRTVATLPLGGEQTVGSRAAIENSCSRMLWEYFPLEFLQDMEEGLAESDSSTTSWRKVLRPA